jgi:hypothetical protein
MPWALVCLLLIERAWQGGHYEGLRSLIHAVVQKVDVRADGMRSGSVHCPAERYANSGWKQ